MLYTTHKVLPVGIKVVAAHPAGLTTWGGSECLVGNDEDPLGFPVTNSLVLLAPTPDWEPALAVRERGVGSPGNSVVVWDWVLIKPSLGEGLGINACSWAIDCVKLCAGEDPFPAISIIAWAWAEK
jgi:hypothetical protein